MTASEKSGLRKTGRPTKLTPPREQRILAAVQQGALSYDDAARLAGIHPKTFELWRRRAREVAAILPADWRDKLPSEIVEMARDLGIEREDVRGTGPHGRVQMSDWVAAVEQEAGRFREFFDRLSAANLEGEMAAVAALRTIAHGGTTVDGQWVPRIRRKTTTKRTPGKKKGEESVTEVSEEVLELGPSETALRYILERRYNRWTPRKAIDGSSAPDDPLAIAAKVAEALRHMEDSLSPEPETAAN